MQSDVISEGLEEKVRRLENRIAGMREHIQLSDERAEEMSSALADLIRFASSMPGYSIHPFTAKARGLSGST